MEIIEMNKEKIIDFNAHIKMLKKNRRRKINKLKKYQKRKMRKMMK